MKKEQKPLSYEAALQELQQIVDALQQEIVSVDDLANTIQKAKELSEFCKTKLKSAEEALKTVE